MSSTTEEALTQPDADVEVIRARFNEMVAADGRPLARIAPETSVAYATLSAWKTSTYKGDNERIAKQVAAWITTRTASERTKATMKAEPPFIMTETASRIWEVLEHAQTMPAMVLITGGAGLGKTTSVRAYAARASNVWVATAEPIHTNYTAVLALVAHAIGNNLEWRASQTSLEIQKRLRSTKGLLIIDEAQNLSADMRNQLRSTVFDLAGVGIALVGNEEMQRIYKIERSDARYAQLFRRIGLKIHQEKPLLKDVRMLMDAWGLNNAGARKIAQAIALQPGAIGVLTQVLRMAFALADARGDEAPAEDDIATCYRQLGGES